jgi:hypothetical protein
MNNKEILQQYINNVRRHFAPYLRPGIGLSCKVFPTKGEGAILEFKIGPNVSNSDDFEPERETINEALSQISQHEFGGNLRGFKFGGTNVIMEKDGRIILIKGEDDPTQWTDAAALDDVRRILPPKIRG